MARETSQASSLLAWSPEFELGVPEIDRQHRRLLAAVNVFAHALEHGVGAPEAIAALLREAIAHFDFEEALMRRARYRSAALHAEQHSELLAAMERLEQRLAHDLHEVRERRTLDFLRDWFSIHIVRTDAELARYLKAPELAESPV